MSIRLKSPLLFIFFTLTFLLYPLTAAAQESPQDSSVTTTTSASSLRVVRITPNGTDIPAGNQIVITFDRPVVPLGKMERSAKEIPISISPDLNCEWRWLNSKSLACQLTEENTLKSSTKYKLFVEAKAQSRFIALDGSTMGADFEHSFITSRPQIKRYWIKTWKSPSWPEIIVVFDQEVEKTSLEKHIFFQNSEGERIGVTTSKSERYGEFRWSLQPDKELPQGSSIRLKVEPGIRPVRGNSLSVEKRDVVVFDTFGGFDFKGIRCRPLNSEQTVILKSTPLAEQPECNPMERIELLFSAPLVKEAVEKGLTFEPDLAGDRRDFNPWDHIYSYSSLSRPHAKDQYYELHVPLILKADHEYKISALSENIKDEFGRELSSPIEFSFKTSHRPPNFHFGGPWSVLEKEVDTHVPIYLTNLQSLELNYSTITAGNPIHQGRRMEVLPAVEDIAYAYPLKMREFLKGKSGIVYGNFSTTPATGQGPSWYFNQVTPFQVHFKFGHFSSLAWISRLDDGSPVQGARVELIVASSLKHTLARDVRARAVSDANGRASLPGTEALDPELKLVNQWNSRKPIFFLRVEQNGDLAYLPIYHEFLNYTYGIYSRQRKHFGHIETWGTTAQGVYRTGDNVQYKIYVRNQNTNRFVPAPRKSYSLKIIDPMGKTVSTVEKIKLSEFGALDGQFRVAKNAAVGWYRFELSSSFSKQKWTPMSVLITDFTPSPFRVSSEIEGEQFKAGEEITVHSRARLHSGGPYTDAAVRVSARLEQKGFSPQTPEAKGFNFSVNRGSPYSQAIYSTQEKLDEKGDHETSFEIGNDKAIQYGRIIVESAIRDDRGKYVASNSSATFIGRDRFVGLRLDSWTIQQNKTTTVDALVVDENGKPKSGTKVNILLEREDVKASRVKGAGNAYLTKYVTEWLKESECNLESKETIIQCQVTPKGIGYYRVIASIEDTEGKSQQTELWKYSLGTGQSLWKSNTDYKLEIVEEQSEYKLGDTARFLVKNPYPGARALISIERYGVLKSWVQTLENSAEIIEVPIEQDFLPGFYLSVLVTSPRVDKPIQDGIVDLGKPTYRLGYSRISVKDPYKELKINVQPARKEYKPRDKVDIELDVKDSRGGVAKVELAVAVLDEAVFDLIAGGQDNYDPYKGFYSLDALDVRNYNILKQLVGQRKFEKKGANPGGGGGKDSEMRDSFKYVSYWNPSIIPDASGKASISFEAPDNLTGWRVLVLAVDEADQMGLGQASFAVNKSTELRPALPNQILEGDEFIARFSLMNRTKKVRTINVEISASGPIVQTAPFKTQILAAPYKRNIIELPIKSLSSGEVQIQVRAEDSLDSDSLLANLTVNKSFSLETVAIHGTTTDPFKTEPIVFPEDMRTDVGEVSLTSSPSVVSSLDGAFTYIRDYPYPCWEQKISKAVAASQYLNLKQYLSPDIEWKDADKLVGEILALASAYQAPNGGMTYYNARDEYVSPYLSAYTAIAFQWLRNSKHDVPIDVENRLHLYLGQFLRKNVQPDFYSDGMASTVRAVALAALTMSGKSTKDDILRYKDHRPQMNLFGKSHFLQAALRVGGLENTARETLDDILSYASESSGKFVFTETLDTRFSRILDSGLRSNCAILSGLIDYQSQSLQKDYLKDIPFKLVRFISQSRKRKDRWENTQENVFCMNALVEFSQTFEKTKPDFTVSAKLGDETLGEAKFNSLRNEPIELDRKFSVEDPGRSTEMQIAKKGPGRLYYTTRLSYAPAQLRTNAINSGIELRREYSVERDGSWEVLDSPSEIKQGEVVRVDLFITLSSAKNFVVIDDPIPGGLEPVNTQLATASGVDAAKGSHLFAKSSFWHERRDWISYGWSRWSFYHRELRHDAARFYSEYLPAGSYHLSYTAQAIAPGSFTVLPTHGEEMYDPDVFGKTKPSELKVRKLE